MPWWIWLILALFMLAMIVAGLIYAALHGIRALKDMSDIGGQLGERGAAGSVNAWPRWGSLAPLPTPASRLCSLSRSAWHRIVMPRPMRT